MALTTEPTDAEILDLWESFVGEPTEEIPLSDSDKLCFARAALRSWGQPSGAGEVVAWRYRMRGDLQWQYTERPEQFAHADEVQPLTTPQPTQAQAGAVPLTCAWAHNENDGFWESACGEAWRFDDGGPAENSMHFCHSCGKSLRINAKEAGNAE